MTQIANKLKNVLSILASVRSCHLCTELALGPKPILQLGSSAKILIAGQAPGRKTHHKGIPFDDASGERLREWMGVTREVFYDESKIAILPMAFCYPGTGANGDVAPPLICAQHWREQLLNLLSDVELTLILGQHAFNYHLADKQYKNLTETVKHWQQYWPEFLPMPHPSPRNNRWLKNNTWFFKEVLPELKKKVASLV
ncbi:uracil-DNA glycosylase family protein [Agaribacterium sp. ZY112]|uniref:uracil-DNA glycosylase family protein n=1 Tax=Agaribacterium sp. ZY112 TaxID=3233574 RepID=UPI0035238E3B